MYIKTTKQTNSLGEIFFQIEEISQTPKEGFEEIKEIRTIFHRNWSVGYSAEKDRSLTQQYELRSSYKDGEVNKSGTKHTMGAYEGYYIDGMTINGKPVKYWYGNSGCLANEILETLDLDMR